MAPFLLVKVSAVICAQVAASVGPMNWHFPWQICRWQQWLHIWRFWGGNSCYRYISGSFCCNYAGDCFCWNYVVRSFCSTYTGDSVCSNMWVTIFIIIIQMGVSVAVMHVIFSAVDYAHYTSCCNYAGDSFLIAMQVTVLSNNFIFLSLTDRLFL